MDIFKKFKDITGLDLLERRSNMLSDRKIRKDMLFSQLAGLYVQESSKIRQLCDICKDLEKSNFLETAYALKGYVYYILEDFKIAQSCFLKNVHLNPDNLDNWHDLAFSLRHLREDKMSFGIIFNLPYVVHYYKYFKLRNCPFIQLKKMICMIADKNMKNDK
jgi:tetratricopeptide (TPR) repeat protein